MTSLNGTGYGEIVRAKQGRRFERTGAEYGPFGSGAKLPAARPDYPRPFSLW